MISDFDKLINFLIKHKLTADQFVFCWLVEMKQVDQIRRYQKETGAFKLSDIKYLIDNEYILNVNAEGYDIGGLVTLPKFSQAIFIEDDDAFEEILDLYPKTGMINGQTVSLRNASTDNLTRIYGKIIKKNKDKHEEIKKQTKIVVQLMKDGKLNWMGIGKYVEGRNWELAEGDLESRGSAFTTI